LQRLKPFRTCRCQSCGENAKRLAALTGYARPEVRGSCKCLFSLHVAVMPLQFGWQTGCTTTTCSHQGDTATSRHRDRSFDLKQGDPLKGFAIAEFLLRRDISSIKKELIAANLTLTESESTRLWQVYEQYSADISKINDKKMAILNEYSEEYDTLSDDRADNLIRRWLETDIEQAKLRQRFAAIFRKVLPGKKAATFLQLERRISMMMDVQLTSGLPLAQSEV
jgi:hypothetical protein